MLRAFLVGLAFAFCGSLPAQADVFNFATPSDNIHCTVGLEPGSADIECTIFQRQGPDAYPRPADCQYSWGHVFILTDRGPPQMACGPLPGKFPAQGVAPYGETGTFNLITCLSERTGLTCRNADGHGFFLSRRQQSVF